MHALWRIDGEIDMYKQVGRCPDARQPAVKNARTPSKYCICISATSPITPAPARGSPCHRLPCVAAYASLSSSLIQCGQARCARAWQDAYSARGLVPASNADWHWPRDQTVAVVGLGLLLHSHGPAGRQAHRGRWRCCPHT
eukprot:scaffold249529_cov35-Tisochrysis_lutea.AAC.3